LGAKTLLAPAGDFVLALLGTGTAFAAVRGDKVSHLGGTPLGGGSFAGIARRIDATLTYLEMIAAAARGDRRNADLMVSDAYAEGIGRIGGDMTAAHLSKQGDASLDDVLAALLNLHGENIAQIAASRAIIAQPPRLVLAGGFAHQNPSLVSSITSMATLFGVQTQLAPHPGFAGAIGAAIAAAR
jgi:type II pantothenate kinase